MEKGEFYMDSTFCTIVGVRRMSHSSCHNTDTSMTFLSSTLEALTSTTRNYLKVHTITVKGVYILEF